MNPATQRWGTSRTNGLLVLAALAALAGCGGEPPPEVAPQAEATSAPISVYAVNYPLQYFAERVGGERVQIVLASPSEGDPALYSPDPETIAEIQSADLIVLNGAGYAGWVEKATLPAARLVDTSAALAERLIPLQAGPTHSHGPEGEHTHDGVAFTTWLDPQLASAQAEALTAALVAASPADEAAFRSSLAGLQADLEALDRRLAGWAEEVEGEPLVFSHPVYQYFERRYGIDGASVHWEPDEAPSPEMWSELERLLTEHLARWMIWEDRPLAETEARLADMGITSLVVSPAATPSAEADFLARMADNAAELERMAAGGAS